MPKLKGAARLRFWLDQHKTNQREFAERAEMHWTHVNQLLSGRRKPSLAMAMRIEKLTGVPAGSWMSPAECQADASARAERRRKRQRAATSVANQPTGPTDQNATDALPSESTDGLEAGQ